MSTVNDKRSRRTAAATPRRGLETAELSEDNTRDMLDITLVSNDDADSRGDIVEDRRIPCPRRREAAALATIARTWSHTPASANEPLEAEALRAEARCREGTLTRVVNLSFLAEVGVEYVWEFVTRESWVEYRALRWRGRAREIHISARGESPNLSPTKSMITDVGPKSKELRVRLAANAADNICRRTYTPSP